MKPTKLDIFDFDGTLFDSPMDSDENKRKYEEEKGLPWSINKEKAQELSLKLNKKINTRRGWWGRKETLEPPLVPDPAPKEWFIESTVTDFKKSKQDPTVETLLLTGRHTGLRKQIERILEQGDVHDENFTLFLNGDNGPAPQGTKPNNTFDWKVWIIDQHLFENPNIEIIEIWEDREHHVQKFKEYNNKVSQTVIVNHVTFK